MEAPLPTSAGAPTTKCTPIPKAKVTPLLFRLVHSIENTNLTLRVRSDSALNCCRVGRLTEVGHAPSDDGLRGGPGGLEPGGGARASVGRPGPGCTSEPRVGRAGQCLLDAAGRQGPVRTSASAMEAACQRAWALLPDRLGLWMETAWGYRATRVLLGLALLSVGLGIYRRHARQRRR